MYTIEKKLKQFSEQQLTRYRLPITARDRNYIVIENKQCIHFCSNDYLGLSTEKKIKKPLLQAIKKYGFGSGSSPMISGYFDVQRQLEQEFSTYLNRDRAVFFNSGYAANMGVMTALLSRKQTVFSDKLCHASIVDGIQLSRANNLRYRNIDHLQQLMMDQDPAVVVTEGVYSMGDMAALDQITALAQKNQATVLVDDAHGFGVLGEGGKGSCEHFQLTQSDVPCLILPLGKAFGGFGAIVCGREDLIEAVLQFSRSYCYSTALPPLVAAGNLALLETLQKEHWRRNTLKNLIHFFIQESLQRNLPLVDTDPTPVKCFMVSENEKVIAWQKALLDLGFYVGCIRPPTVPKNTARIRVSLNCYHTEAQIIRLLDLLYDLWKK